jgi:hypothetical protein
MKRTYEGTGVLVRRATGPLASHLDPFIASLIEQQYRASVIYIKALHGLALDRWLAPTTSFSRFSIAPDKRTMSRSHAVLAPWQAALLRVGT